jgi:hypothetical protein
MATELSRVDTITERPWGKANPRRGAGHTSTAVAFLKDHPVGETLSPEAFDEWAQRHGLLNVPTGAPKQSDAWLAHLQRRHQLRYNINKAASHPRMDTPFVIEAVGRDLWEVRSPHIAITRSDMLQRVETLLVAKRKQLNYLMQSADWSILPPYERVIAEEIYNDIDAFQEDVERQASRLGRRLVRLEHKIRRAVETGEVQPVNGGIKAILDGESLVEIDD